MRTRPSDPEKFASVVTALRAAVDRNPRNEFEREMVAALQNARVRRRAIERMLGNFDRLTPARQRQATGEFAGRRVTPKREAASPPPTPGRRVGGARSAVIELSGLRDQRQLAGGPLVVAGDDLGPAVQFYALDYMGFHCDREVGDWGWSDEVYAITSVASIRPNGDNAVRTEKHPFNALEYENVDYNETRLGPIQRCYQGVDFPLSLTVVAYERDYGDPDYYKDEVEAAVWLALLIATRWSPAGAGTVAILEAASGILRDSINWLLGTDDDQIDIPRTAIFQLSTVERLGRQGPTAWVHHANILGYEYEEETPLRAHFFSRHSGNGGRYVFGFNFVRDPEFEIERPDPGDVD
jgi:hypothetical protein